MLREPISLLLALAMLLGGVATVAARQTFQSSYQGGVTAALDASRPRLQTMGRALGDFVSGRISEDLLRLTLDTSRRETAAALEPLSSMPELRGTFLDETDAAAHRTSQALRAELDELGSVLEARAGLVQVAYRTQRVLSLLGPSGSGLTLDPRAMASARRLWLQTYARELTRVDADVQSQTDDLARWRNQALPDLANAGRWNEVKTRLARGRGDLQRDQDRLRGLPAPPEALRPLGDYTAALAHLERFLQALETFADGRAPASLRSADQELAAYQAARPPAASALSQLGDLRAGH